MENRMSDFTPLPGRFTGRHMLIIMIAFFGVIIAVNMVMAFAASRAWTGLVVKNSYVASQNFNADMANARRQASLGWMAGLDIADGTALVSLTRKETAAQPLQDLTVTLRLSRPTHEADDRVVSLSETAPGHYQASLKIADGLWNAENAAVSPSGESFSQVHLLVISAGSGA